MMPSLLFWESDIDRAYYARLKVVIRFDVWLVSRSQSAFMQASVHYVATWIEKPYRAYSYSSSKYMRVKAPCTVHFACLRGLPDSFLGRPGMS